MNVKTIMLKRQTYYLIQDQKSFSELWNSILCDKRETIQQEHTFSGFGIYRYAYHIDPDDSTKNASILKMIDEPEYRMLKEIYDFIDQYYTHDESNND